jgi:hypothetical protein
MSGPGISSTTLGQQPRLPLALVALNLLTLAVTLVMNFLANALPLNGRTTGEISDAFSANVFVPAGYVFSVWGLIYAGLIAFAAYQLSPAGRGSAAVRSVAGWFALSGVANSAWIVLWHYGVFGATMLVMLVLLVALCMIVARLAVARTISAADRWLVYVPFSVYLGWISVATIANASIFLLDLGWTGAPIGMAAWAIVMLGLVTALGTWMVLARGNVAYTAVLVWAFVGIALRQSALPPVSQVAWSGAAVLLMLVVWRLLGSNLVWPNLRRRVAPLAEP